MALLEKQLVVKESTIPGAGKGLFTTHPIPKGTRIVEYKGRRSSWKEANHQEGMNGYIFFINRNNVIDAANHKSALARYANDAKGIGKVTKLTNNASYVRDGYKVYIEAVKDIPAGAEILVSYGKDYWDVIRRNKKELEKEAKTKRK
jgi:uncharacterized protein